MGPKTADLTIPTRKGVFLEYAQSTEKSGSIRALGGSGSQRLRCTDKGKGRLGSSVATGDVTSLRRTALFLDWEEVQRGPSHWRAGKCCETDEEQRQPGTAWLDQGVLG